MYARIGRADAPVIYTLDYLEQLRIGKGIIVEDGDDISIIACGTMVDVAIDAHHILKKKGISAQIIDMHTIKPLDRGMIQKCLNKTGKIITTEEHSIIGGLGGAVAEFLVENCSNKSFCFKRMGIRDQFCESGSPADLFEKYKLNAKYLALEAENLISS
jgi:transketolase